MRRGDGMLGRRGSEGLFPLWGELRVIERRSGDGRNSWFERWYVVERVEWNAISRECRHESGLYLGIQSLQNSESGNSHHVEVTQ